jgi:nucleoid-associated protein YgaU
VDIYEPRPGDTWESISREFYQDARYAAALRAYNRNKPLGAVPPLHGSGAIDIPPLHILRRLGGDASRMSPASFGPGGSSSPTGLQPTGRAVPADPWNAATPTYQPGPATAAPGGFKIYRVPTDGLSLPTIARQLLGNERRWVEIYDLNPEVNASRVPAGTELRLPADARLPGGN